MSWPVGTFDLAAAVRQDLLVWWVVDQLVIVAMGPTRFVVQTDGSGGPSPRDYVVRPQRQVKSAWMYEMVCCSYEGSKLR